MVRLPRRGCGAGLYKAGGLAPVSWGAVLAFLGLTQRTSPTDHTRTADSERGAGVRSFASLRVTSSFIESTLARDAEFARRAAHVVLGRAGGDHQSEGKDVGRGGEQVIALGDADRLQR